LRSIPPSFIALVNIAHHEIQWSDDALQV